MVVVVGIVDVVVVVVGIVDVVVVIVDGDESAEEKHNRIVKVNFISPFVFFYYILFSEDSLAKFRQRSHLWWQCDKVT